MITSQPSRKLLDESSLEKKRSLSNLSQYSPKVSIGSASKLDIGQRNFDFGKKVTGSFEQPETLNLDAGINSKNTGSRLENQSSQTHFKKIN